MCLDQDHQDAISRPDLGYELCSCCTLFRIDNLKVVARTDTCSVSIRHSPEPGGKAHSMHSMLSRGNRTLTSSTALLPVRRTLDTFGCGAWEHLSSCDDEITPQQSHRASVDILCACIVLSPQLVMIRSSHRAGRTRLSTKRRGHTRRISKLPLLSLSRLAPRYGGLLTGHASSNSMQP